MSKANNDNGTRSAFEKTDCDLRTIFDELEGQVASYRKALNDICKVLGLTDGTGLPEMGEIICAEIQHRISDDHEIAECVRERGGLDITKAQCKFAEDAAPWIRKLAEYEDDEAVLAADGEPLEVGQTVYTLNDDRPYTVKRLENGQWGCVYINAGGSASDLVYPPDYLTHTKPDPPDSWEKLEKDAEDLRHMIAVEFGDYLFDGSGKDSVQTRLIDIVRRAKALAEE